MSHGEIPQYISDGLEKQDPATLREISKRAEQLATQKERELERELEEREVDEEERPDDIDRNNTPQRATLTTKTINDNDYYYWQWREGSKIKSEYIRPVSPSE